MYTHMHVDTHTYTCHLTCTHRCAHADTGYVLGMSGHITVRVLSLQREDKLKLETDHTLCFSVFSIIGSFLIYVLLYDYLGFSA